MSSVRPATKYKKKDQRYAEVVALHRQRSLQQRAAPQFHIRSCDCVEVESVFACRWFSKWNCFPNSRVRDAEESQCCQSDRFQRAERFWQMPACCDFERFLRVEESPWERFRHAERSLSSFFALPRCHSHGFRMVKKLWSILCDSERFHRAERFSQMPELRLREISRDFN